MKLSYRYSIPRLMIIVTYKKKLKFVQAKLYTLILKMLELINLFGLSNCPDLSIEFNDDDTRRNSSDDSDSSSSSLDTSASERIHNPAMTDNLVFYKKVEVGKIYPCKINKY